MGIYCMIQGTQTRVLGQPRGLGWGGREVQEGGDICIPMANSCWYMAETTQCYKAIIFQLKINKFIKWVVISSFLKLTIYIYMLTVTDKCSVVSNSLHPMDCSPWGSSVHGIFSRQEYWSGLPFPSPGDLPEPGIQPGSLASPALAGRQILYH